LTATKPNNNDKKMTKDRSEYYRDYARRNAARRKEIKDAWRARNKEKIAAYARRYRAAKATEPREPSKPHVYKSRRTQAQVQAEKVEAFQTLRSKFAAFRAAKIGGAA